MEVAIFLFAIVYLVVAVAGVTVALTWSVRRKIGFFKALGVVLATLFVIYAIPFGDHTLGEIKKQQLCKENGGAKIYQVVEKAEGFMWEKSGGQRKGPYTTYGYAFVEASNSKGQIFRYGKNLAGVVESEEVDKARARYIARLTRDESVGPKYAITRFSITDVRENKVLATYGIVSFRGGWMGFGSVNCPEEQFDPITFVSQVLKR